MASTIDDERLDPELAARYAAERAAPLPAGSEARVLAAVLGQLAIGPMPVGDGGAATGGAGATAAATAAGVPASAAWGAARIVALFLGGAIAGGTVVAVVRAPAPASLAPTLAPAPLAPAPADAGPPTSVADASVPATDASTPHDADGPARPRPPDRAASDDHLIDRARAALRRGMIDDALLVLVQHERRFPASPVAEERDVLLVEAYLAKGDRRLATRRIEAYRRTYPAGFLRGRIDAAAAALAR